MSGGCVRTSLGRQVARGTRRVPLSRSRSWAPSPVAGVRAPFRGAAPAAAALGTTATAASATAASPALRHQRLWIGLAAGQLRAHDHRVRQIHGRTALEADADPFLAVLSHRSVIRIVERTD